MRIALPRPRQAALDGIEWLAIIVAIGIAHAFYARILVYPSAFDATNYLDIALDIGQRGLFSKFHYSQLRTYGYPLFLLGLHELAAAARLPWTFVVFEVQLALHVAALLLLRSRLALVSRDVARIALVATLLNLIALAYVPETLAESLSLTLLVFAAACWVHVYAGERRAWLAVVAGSVAIGAAIAVRPSNVFAAPAWIAALAMVAWLRGWRARRAVVAMVVVTVAAALPLVPQLANNARHYGEWTPLVAASLGRNQQIWGIAYLKYATALPPIELPSIWYLNPFAEGRPVDEQRPLAWYARHPVAGAATLALHTFGMLDQDLLFTYARDLAPWYRRPLGAAVHATVALAVLGFGRLGRRARTDAAARVVFVVLSTFTVAHVALHATTAVEMRFGLPLLMLFGPLAVWFVVDAGPAAPRTHRGAVLAFVVAWIACSLALSDWMRAQSPQIRAWEARSAAGPAR